MVNQRRQGSDYEKAAAAYLQKQGLTILESNFYCKFGEIDIIARDEEYLVFVEVKYRKSQAAGGAMAAVGFKKMRTICRVADYYMISHHMNQEQSVRFDVVAIEAGQLKHIKNAFGYIQ